MKNILTYKQSKLHYLLRQIHSFRLNQNTVVEVICLLYILLFTYAAVTKLLEYEKFSIQLGQSPLLTDFSKWVAWLIPVIELGISVMLAIRKLRLLGLYLAFTLMCGFTAYIITITNFSEYVPCSCGGILENMSWNQHLVFNISFVLLGLAGILLTAKQTSST